VKYSELTRKLRRLGLHVESERKGSHQFWVWPEHQITLLVAYHATRDIPPGTFRAILRTLRITEDDLNKA
jgi:predicted RNA binding protein YcfA (HicA-like mRNA interferase family)